MFERCLFFNVNALARAVNRVWDEAFEKFDLSPPHAYLLRLVLAQPGLTHKAIGVELRLEKSTITRFVDALVSKDLVYRSQHESSDARELGVYPTEKAKRLRANLEVTGDALYTQMSSELGANELKSLVTKLREVTETIE